MSNQPTALEERLAEKAARVKQKRIYQAGWLTCRHTETKPIVIGSVHLEECTNCGFVTGCAR